MSEQAVAYEVHSANLLQSRDNPATIEQEQPSASFDLSKLERMLIPIINEVRKQQGKKPIFVPKE